MADSSAVSAEPFEHLGLLYRDDDSYINGCATFVRQGLGAGEPVLVSVPAANAALLRRELSPAEIDGVEIYDMQTAGRNPGRIIPGLLLDFAARHPGARVWIIGEPIWPGRTAVEYPACAAHEALINVAFRGRDAAILCPYDVTGLTAGAVEDSWSTHPVMIDGVDRLRSSKYGDPIRTAAAFDQPLPVPPADADRYPFTEPEHLTRVRAAVGRHARAAGLPPDRSGDLQLAVDELVANSIRHTPAGDGVLIIWREPGLLVCQVDDRGHLADPMAGRVPPAHGALHGHGLILANTMVDLLRAHTGPSGTSFRVHVHLPGYGAP